MLSGLRRSLFRRKFISSVLPEEMSHLLRRCRTRRFPVVRVRMTRGKLVLLVKRVSK